MLSNYTSALRQSLPEDKAGVIHAIPPFWMKLCRIEGAAQHLWKTGWAGFGIFPLGVRPPPWFLDQNPKNFTKISIKFRHHSCLQNALNFIAI